MGPYLTQSGIGRALAELRCIFGPPGGERAFVPDLSYVAKARLPSSSERHLHVAPDLAIEILSPDQHRPDFLDKIQFYLLNGVRLVWVIDPATSCVVVQAPGQEARVLRSGDALDGGEVLPGFSVPADEIFAQMQMYA